MNPVEPSLSSAATIEDNEVLTEAYGTNYKEPTLLLAEDKILLSAKKSEMETWWREELCSITRSFPNFTQRRYFVNKCTFIEKLLELDSSYNVAIFMPTGCSKTVMSYFLEYFFSYKIPVSERTEMRPLYDGSTEELKQKILAEEAQYYVLRISFRDLFYRPDIPFVDNVADVLRNWVLINEPALLNKKQFKDNIHSPKLFEVIATMLYQKYKKRVVVIIDEMDYPSNAYIIENASELQIKNMECDYNNILTGLARISSIDDRFPIARVIVFGIHYTDSILRTRYWNIFSVQQKSIVNFFMFTREEVETILRNYNLLDKLAEVECHYGKYCGNFFSPASVAAFVNHRKLLMYKWCRRSHDVLDINMRTAESRLLPFIQEKEVSKFVNTDFTALARVEDEKCMLNLYISAGLLCVSDLSKYPNSREYMLGYGNLENLNIIAFFLERVICNGRSDIDPDKVCKALEKSDFSTLASQLNCKMNVVTRIL